MLKTLGSRRRHRYGPQLCALTASLLLLLSVSLLYTRLTPDHQRRRRSSSLTDSATDDPFSGEDPLLQDSDADVRTTNSASTDDRIDELDVIEEEDDSKVFDEEEILRGLDSEGEDIGQSSRLLSSSSRSSFYSSSGYFFDHVSGVIRRAFDRRSIDEIDRWDYQASAFDAGFALDEDRSKVAFGSDDVPVDEEVRRKVVQINGIEDALMLRLGSRDSPLREGWGPWFDAKSDFLRKDRMFKSNLEILNPLSNPLLQDPDGVGVTGLTKGDKLMQKGLLLEMKKVPFIGKKPLGFPNIISVDLAKIHSVNKTSVGVIPRKAEQGYREEEVKRRELDDDVDNDSFTGKSGFGIVTLHGTDMEERSDGSLGSNAKRIASSVGKMGEAGSREVGDAIAKSKSESTGSMYAGRGRWGYFPGLPPYLSFSNFMDSFFRQSKCSVRVFMVWNSPPWMYTVRHQRGLESLLFHHRDACVVVFSETIELDFFKAFQKDGYKIAVAMPNLEELLKDTPTSIFSSVWYEWRSTRYYSTHYSELIRLASLYKYGGIYLDCDVIVLRSLSSFSNSVGEEELSPKRLNGAVLAFRKHSSFIMDCLSEFYSTYDDTQLRWNGADLLTRVAGNFSSKLDTVDTLPELKVQPLSIFFPIGSHDIQRYFSSAVSESEKTDEDVLFRKILDESYTFHFWNSLTSALVPEPESLVARILNHHCIRCFDVL